MSARVMQVLQALCAHSRTLQQRRRSDLKSGGTEKFRLAPSALAKFLHICSYIWAPAEKFPEGRKTTHTLKINHFFGARKTKTTICAFFTDSTLILQKYICIFIFWLHTNENFRSAPRPRSKTIQVWLYSRRRREKFSTFGFTRSQIRAS